ncbi:MAG TPA: DUF5063 domain-containing protein [Syntrophomonas sp.]|nr:DUF5063 domain-containing protein [Syntrophomonas sp.]HRW13462.1 DUF5063 domain-containing protein [Syntrophomonas sp.]
MDYVSAGRFTNEKARQMIPILRQYIPHIHWRSEWSEGELGDAMPYSDIYVPEYQLHEAEHVIGLLENGVDLSNYRSNSSYPDLFEEINGSLQVVKPLAAFAEHVRELINLAEDFSSEDMVGYLRRISHQLIRIYALQSELPDCSGSYYYQPWLNFSLPHKLGPFSLYYDVGNPFHQQVSPQSLEKTLEHILEVLHAGIIHYTMYHETGNYKYLSLAANVWKNQFFGAEGWGTAVVNVLKVFHHAIMYLQQGKLPDQDF